MSAYTGLNPDQRVLVTGAAGFIGSHVTERLLAQGHAVVGVDCFTEYYAREIKEHNLARARDYDAFELLEINLAEDELVGMLDGIDIVIHLAAQPGVRHCFGEGFKRYMERNVLATQRLLEEAAASPVTSFTYASSSSIYGDAASYPTTEETPATPMSPYGMTKVATEQLAGVYGRCHDVPTVGLRYFTVYGPRQRPDMAFHRFIRRCLDGEPIQLIGDGRQVRDFTYVDDAVEATLAAAARGRAGAAYNIGGGEPIQLRDAVAMIGALVGNGLEIDYRPPLIGEARRTGCDGTLAREELGFVAATSLEEGLIRQIEHLASDRSDTLAEA